MSDEANEIKRLEGIVHDYAVEVARRAAVIKGRGQPPTLAEVATHEAAGGWWAMLAPDGIPRFAHLRVVDGQVIVQQQGFEKVRIECVPPHRWWPWAKRPAAGPSAWPEVTL